MVFTGVAVLLLFLLPHLPSLHHLSTERNLLQKQITNLEGADSYTVALELPEPMVYIICRESQEALPGHVTAIHTTSPTPPHHPPLHPSPPPPTHMFQSSYGEVDGILCLWREVRQFGHLLLQGQEE